MLTLENLKLLPKQTTSIEKEIQHLLDIEKTDSTEGISCLKWTTNIGRRKKSVSFKTDTDMIKTVVYRWPKQFIPQR